MFPANAKILVVDDSINHRQMILDTLRRMGFNNIKAYDNADDAYRSLMTEFQKGAPFDLVLSDLNMPGMSGLDYLQKVRATEQVKDVPFVLITTESEKGAVVQAAMHGVSSYVVKPFSVDTLTKRLTETYQKHFSKAS